MCQTAGNKVSLVVVGAGGNIGSHLCRLLARLSQVSRLLLIDKDRYEEKNLLSQDLLASDCGRPKAVVQARQVRRIRADLQVEALTVPVQEVPLGKLRADAILACVDTRTARQYINEAAWRLGVAWLDSGVSADGLLARVKVYLPSAEAPCLECAWGTRDYELLEQAYPCSPDAAEQATPTNAPAALGAVAAGHQALELQKLLSASSDRLPTGGELIVDARGRQQRVTNYHRNPRCRFDHEVWRLEELHKPLAALTVDDLLDSVTPPVAISAAGRPFLRQLTCSGCGASRELLRLAGRLPRSARRCRKCGAPMMASGFHLLPRLEQAALGRRIARLRLTGMGFRTGDVVTVETGAEKHRYLL